MEPFQKQDRVLRLLKELTIFQGAAHGLTTRDLADRMDISQRTAQRDIAALESEIGVPFQLVGSRWKVIPGWFLPPVNLNIQEAMALLLGARLMLRYADRANPFATSAYQKVAAVLPEGVRGALAETAQGLSLKAQDAVYLKVLATLTSAWAERRKVSIAYRSGNGGGAEAQRRTVHPLFLEPSAPGHGCYLIAWDETRGATRNFKLERISDARLLETAFSPPAGFSVARHLAGAWGVWSSEDPVEVVLLFDRSVAARVRETVWHPSQVLEQEADGRLRLRLRVASAVEIRHWVLGWGGACEVVSPRSLRQEVASQARAMARAYGLDGEPARVGRLLAGLEAAAAEKAPRARGRKAG
ncbi:MAG: helix-turn-helix transcriptional regulator [Candidatus Dormibacterales bacterium]